VKRKKNKRVDVTGAGESVPDSRFDALAGLFEDADPQGQATNEAPIASESVPYRVGKTRKGNLDLRVERRSAGKVVTVLLRVSGDASRLLKELRRACGAGGRLIDGGLELQGDQRSAVESFLRI